MRAAGLAIGRLLVSVIILGAVGGTSAIVHPNALAFLGFEAAWSLAEGVLARGDLGRPRAERLQLAHAAPVGEARTFLIAGKRYALANLVFHAIVLGEFARRASAAPRRLGSLTIAGLIVYASGAIVRGWAMALMGDRFKSWTVSREPRGLETGGSYAIVRHPVYLGLLLIAVAMPLIFGQPWLLAAALLPIATIVARVAPEERLLREAYGDEYSSYAAHTRSRLVPGIW